MPGTAEFLIDRLKSNGVDAAFTIPGDYSLGFIDKVYKSGKIELIGTTSEAAAGFAADAYARIKGIGCVIVTYCVGGLNICNAIGGAFAEKSPVVVISGSHGVKERDQNILLHHMVGSFESQYRVFSNFTCASTVLRDSEKVGYEIDRVLSSCRQHSQPVYIELPRDMVDKAIRYDPYAMGTPHDFISDPENLKEALEEVISWLNSAKNPVILAGVECARFGLGEMVIKFCDNVNIPIATTILGKSVVSERHPLCLGVYSSSCGREDVREYVENSDCLIMLGVMMTDMNLGFLPLKNQKRSVVLSSCRSMQIRNHTYEDVWFVDFVNGLAKSRLPRRADPCLPWRERVSYCSRSGQRLTANRLFEKISSVLASGMAVIADMGDSLFGALDIVVDRHHFLSQAFYTSMGFAVPAALGVQIANPNIRPIVLVGDGAFQMTGLEFSTLVKRSQEGKASNAIIVVINNGGYATERILRDGPYNDIQGWSHENIPALVGGGIGFRVETEEELDKAFSLAIKSKGPSIINCVISKKDHTEALKKMFSRLAKEI
jgi:TPP-dependent 2-oxoacid decarboxylase